jgi:nucleotide-binding universal stress UspA family protein
VEKMSWVRILAPLAGGPAADGPVLAAADALARPFGAELAAAYAPADAADLTPWMGEGFMGGAPMAALESLREAAAEGERAARTSFEPYATGANSFAPLDSPVWSSLCMEARLADVVVFGADPARGKGPLVEAFQQVLMEERRPILVARGQPLEPNAPVAIAWDGGKEATRAARSIVPWLQLGGEAVVLAATSATPRQFEPQRLVDYFQRRGVRARLHTLAGGGEPGPLLLSGVKAVGASLLVAGAFGHPRFQQFIFGGTTRHLMQVENGPSLFLSH